MQAMLSHGSRAGDQDEHLGLRAREGAEYCPSQRKLGWQVAYSGAMVRQL
jgi:hypothetical protein